VWCAVGHGCLCMPFPFEGCTIALGCPYGTKLKRSNSNHRKLVVADRSMSPVEKKLHEKCIGLSNAWPLGLPTEARSLSLSYPSENGRG
jgi:hypothetical protein